MGDLDFSTMRQMIKLAMGQDSALESVGTSATNYYSVWVNQAYKQICSQDYIMGIKKKCKFPQLETNTTAATVDGTAYVSVPVGTLVVRHLYDETNGRKLNYIPHSAYVAYTDRADTSAEGEPTEWTRSGDNLYLHKTPGAAYTIRIYYKKAVTDLSGDTDTTVIGAEWDEPIVLLATYKAQLRMGEFEKAKATEKEVLSVVAGLVGVYDAEEMDRNETRRPDPAYWRLRR